MSRPAKLSPRQEAFVREYLIDLNATAAYIRAGYKEKGARQNAARLIANDNISAAIQEAMASRSQRTEITADRVLEEFARLALVDMREFSTWGPNGVTLKSSTELSPALTSCVAEVTETRGAEGGGSIRFKLHSKTEALTQVARHLGMFIDRHEHTGANGEPIQIIERIIRSRAENRGIPLEPTPGPIPRLNGVH